MKNRIALLLVSLCILSACGDTLGTAPTSDSHPTSGATNARLGRYVVVDGREIALADSGLSGLQANEAIERMPDARKALVADKQVHVGAMEVRMSKSQPDAPPSMVEVSVGGRPYLTVTTSWTKVANKWVVKSREFKRTGADGLTTRGGYRTSEADRVAIAMSRSTASRSALTDVLAREDCGDGGFDRNPLNTIVAEESEGCGGCALKFAAMTAAGAAASVLFGAGVAGFLGTLATGGVLLPAEAAIVAAWMTAEGVFLDRLDRWLDCMYPPE